MGCNEYVHGKDDCILSYRSCSKDVLDGRSWFVYGKDDGT